jgi:opacity protein-like surface antigen
VADVGGWDATAKLDYQFATFLEYKVSPNWSIGAGYRYLFVDYRPNPGAVFNMVTSGAVLGATWNLK